MPRPCHRRHPSVESHPDCLSCRVWEGNEAFRTAWTQYEIQVQSQHEHPDAPPCRHRSPLIPLTERYKYNLGTVKDWYKCDLGFGNNGLVCPCQGCNAMCVGYAVPDDLTTIEDD